MILEYQKNDDSLRNKAMFIKKYTLLINKYIEFVICNSFIRINKVS